MWTCRSSRLNFWRKVSSNGGKLGLGVLTKTSLPIPISGVPETTAVIADEAGHRTTCSTTARILSSMSATWKTTDDAGRDRAHLETGGATIREATTDETTDLGPRRIATDGLPIRKTPNRTSIKVPQREIPNAAPDLACLLLRLLCGKSTERMRHRRFLCGLALSFLCGSVGCSFVFDDSAPDIVLVGEAPVVERFPKLNVQPARDVFLVYDSLGKPWAVIPELPELPFEIPDGVTLPTLPETIRLVRLDPQEDPTTAATFPSRYLLLSQRSLYIMITPQILSPDSKDKSVLLTRLRPLESPQFLGKFPEGTPLLLLSSDENIGVLLSQSSKSKTFRIFSMTTKDGTSNTLRELPIPDGVDPEKPLEKGRFVLDGTGEHLIVQDGNSVITLYETKAGGSQLSLGKQTRSWSLNAQKNALLLCNEGGLSRLPLNGTPAQRLDADSCSQDIFRLTTQDGVRTVLYKSGEGLRQVPEDGSQGPRLRLSFIGQFFGLSQKQELLYSTDDAVTYGAGIGNGLLEGRPVFEIGRRPAFSQDQTRLRVLEWAARSDGAGDLQTRWLDSDQVLHLARNVRMFAETTDGRVVAASYSIPKGTHNQVIVIDEIAKQALWVADSSREFLLIPGTTDALVKVVIGQTGWDIRRTPIPAP